MRIADLLDEACPSLVAMGMTPDEFWNGDTRNIRAYRKAHLIKRQLAEEEAWLHGLYVGSAIAAALSKDARYPEQPIGVFGSEEQAEAKAAAAQAREEAASRSRIEEFKQRWYARRARAEEGEPTSSTE